MKHLFTPSQLLLVFSTFFLLFSCKESEMMTVKKDHLIFESSEDYKNAVKATTQMDLEELNAWQSQRGFKSFTVEALNRYYSFDFENAKNEQEINQFIDYNSDYLELVERDGELYLETKYHNYSDRFLYNEDQIVQIGNRLIKAFPKGKLSTDVQNIEDLKSITEQDFTRLSENSEELGDNYQIFQNQGNSLNSRLGYCGTSQSARSTSNRDRTLSEITMKDNSPSGDLEYTFRVLVRPYKKTLGIWYHCTRTISANWNYSAWVNTGSGYESVGASHPGITRSATHIEQEWTYDALNGGNHGGYFYDIYVYGDTPSTAAAVIDCD